MEVNFTGKRGKFQNIATSSGGSDNLEFTVLKPPAKIVQNLLAALCCLALKPVLSAQDLEFSQVYNMPVYENPAFSGADAGPRFSLAHRNQWGGLGNAYLSFAVAADQWWQPVAGGVALMAVSDLQADGLYQRNSFAGAYAYRIRLSEKLNMQVAALVSAEQRRLRTDRLIFAENINPLDGTLLPGSSSADLPDQSSRLFADFATGVLLFSDKFFFGLAAKHPTTPNESLYGNASSPLPFRWSVQLGKEYRSKQKYRTPVFFDPYAFYAEQGRFRQLQAGALLGVGVVYGGLSLRHNLSQADALILHSGLQRGMFRFGYSFDASLSPLKKRGGGTHELTLAVNLADSEKISASRHRRLQTRCPGIF